MEDEGVSKGLIARSIYYETSTLENSFKETLKLVTNPKTGNWTCETLQNAGRLSDAEIEGIKVEYKGLLPPYYYIPQIRLSRVID
jgi:hypothetical protein